MVGSIPQHGPSAWGGGQLGRPGGGDRTWLLEGGMKSELGGGWGGDSAIFLQFFLKRPKISKKIF